MKCFGYGLQKCDQPGTIPDRETRAIFINPEDPNGPACPLPDAPRQDHAQP